MKEKKLIIHMDDIGLLYSANEAAKELFYLNCATSASVMIPCPFASEFIMWAKEHKEYDVGIHSTVTCEWENLKWRQTFLDKKLESITNEYGFMISGLNGEMDTIKPDDFIAEITSQIEIALTLGLNPSHLDNHMWPVLKQSKMLDAYISLANQYHILPNLPSFGYYEENQKEWINTLGFPISDGDIGIEDDKEKFYHNLRNLKEGVTVLTTHPMIDTPEARKVIPNYQERVKEYEILKDPQTKKELEENNIQLVSWADRKK